MKNPLSILTYEELDVIWDAISQYSENRSEDENGNPVENKALDSVENKLDAFFADEFRENLV
jgi:hypothetical protein